QECTGFSRNRLDSGEDGVTAWRSEDFSDHSSAQHANANVALVRRLMATTSARDYRHLLVTGSFRICADHNLVSQQTDRTWVKHGQALHHFFYDIFGTVNELFHDKANAHRRVAGRSPKW